MPTDKEETTEQAGPAVSGGAMSAPIVAVDTRPRRGTTAAGVVVVALLLAVSAALILQGGAYDRSAWLPLMVAVAGLALVVAVAGPAVCSGRVQKVILLIFGLQAAWTATSLLWAGGRADAWEETNRTLFYALAVFLTFTAVRWAREAALKALVATVTTLASAVALTVLVSLVVNPDPVSLFLQGRLNYPITYFNGLAALLMVGFWLTLGLASGARCASNTESEDVPENDSASEDHVVQSRVAWRRSQANKSGGDRFGRWTQPVTLALAVVLAEVALLPQSRGALWTFFLVVPFYVILSPNRFRALVNLAIVVAPVVLFWGKLMHLHIAIASTGENAGPRDFLLAVGLSIAVVVGAWLVTWLVERWVGPLRRKVAVWISVVLAALTIFGAAGGIVYADMHTGGVDHYLTDRWHEMTADHVGASPGATRFTGVGLNGRWTQWKVALAAFRENPALGLGAQNFEAYWYQHRPVAFTVRQPHSQPLQLLSELGLPGVILWLAFVFATLIWAATTRFKASSWVTRVLVAAMTTAVISWFIHSSADWLWQLAGVSLPVMMLVGGLIAADRGPRADTTQSPARRRPILRTVASLVALVALASAALPYVSLRYSGFASGSADLEQAVSRAHVAAALDPTSIEPYVALASVHKTAATSALDRVQRLQQLRLAAEAWEDALRIDATSWVSQYGAAEALVAARNAVLADDKTVAQELEQKASIHLEEARRLNPLSPEIGELQRGLDRFSSIGSY